MRYLGNFIDFYQHQDSYIFWATSSSIILALFVILIWLLNIFNLPSQIPLFYSLPWGESQLATLNQFIIIPSTIILITLINLIISWHLHPSQIIIKRILSISAALSASLLTITAAKIIFTFV